MNNKKAFTLIELLAIIAIIAILLLLIIPSVNRFSNNSKVKLKDSKIITMQVAAEKYANERINMYKDCIGTLDKTNTACKVSIRTLIDEGFLRGVKEKNCDKECFLNPVTNEEFIGDIFVCYDSSDVSVYTVYSEDDEVDCSHKTMNSSPSFRFKKSKETRYFTEGNTLDDIVVGMNKTGEFTSFSCKSNKDNIAECNVDKDGTQMTINIKSYLEGEIVFTVTGKFKDGTLDKTYTLNLQKTSFDLANPDDNNVCMEIGTQREVQLTAKNEKVDIINNQTNILNARHVSGKLYLSASEPGTSILQVINLNSNQSFNLTSHVYKLNFANNMIIPDIINAGKNDVTVELDYGGFDELIVSLNNDNINIVEGQNLKNSITLTGGANIFTLRANPDKENNSETKLTIKGKKKITENEEEKNIDCGNVFEKTITIKTLNFSEKVVDIYKGESFETKILGENDNLSCYVEDNTYISCSIHGNTLKITGNAVKPDGVNVTVENNSIVSNTIRVNVLEPSLSLDSTKLCRDITKNSNDSSIGINTSKLSDVYVKNTKEDDWYLVEASIDRENGKVIVNPRDLDLANVCDDGTNTCTTVYKQGKNTGKATITLTSGADIPEVSFDYYIYSYKLSSTSMNIKVTESDDLTIEASHAGDLTAKVLDTSIASVTLTKTASDDSVNGIDKYTLKVDGLKKGTTKIEITGADCGSRTIDLVVKENTYTVNFAKGTNTSSVGKTSESCSFTSGTSCQVNLPSITPNTGYTKLGFSETSTSTTAEYTGTKLTVDSSNNGKTFYGISYDNTPPECSFQAYTSKIQIGSTPEITLICTDNASGMSNSSLNKNNITVNNTNIAEVSTTSGPTLSNNNKDATYKIGINVKSSGTFTLGLKANSIKDNANNYNSAVTSVSYSSLEYEAKEIWEIGKTNRSDVVAVLYDNKYAGNGAAGTYTLKLSGSGDMLEFNAITSSSSSGGPWYYAPWYNSYRSSITKVEINNGITNIGTHAFRDMTITSITLPDSIKNINDYAFYNERFTSLTIPASVETIGNNAFSQSSSNRTLTSLTFASGSKLKSIGNSAFYYHKISSLSIPPSVETIGNYAFYEPTEYDSNGNLITSSLTLTSVSFGSNSKLKTIGSYAFYNNKASSLTIPASVETINYGAFCQDYEISNLSSLTFETNSKLKTIDGSAFGNNGLSSLNIPASVEYIGNSAFSSGKTITLRTVTFASNSNLQTIGSFAFYDNHVSSWSLPNSVKKIDSWAFGNEGYSSSLNLGPNVSDISSPIIISQNFTRFNIDANNPNYVSVNGIIYTKDMKKLVSLPSCYFKAGYSSLVIPESVTEIQTYAVYGYTWTSSNSSERMTITLPKNLNENNANFSTNFHWFNISYLYVNSENPYLSSDNGVVYNKNYTTAYVLPADYLGTTNYTIKNTTTTINDEFGYGQLRVSKVTIPASVSYIGYNAFATDPKWGYKNVYLNSNSNLSFSSSAFSFITFWDSSGARIRNIYVKSQELKDRLDSTLYVPDIKYYNYFKYNIVVQ